MDTVSPTPIDSPSLPLPDPADRATFGDRMREQLRWQREDAQPGFELLASQTYQNAQAAEDASVAAIGSANFKGEWSALSGALNVPSAVWHNSRVWALLVNLADVTASEPGVSADWVDVGGVKRSGDTMTGPLSVPELTATDRLKIPTWTTAGRPSSPAVGDTGFNTTLGTNETWNGSNWVPEGIGGSATVSTVGTAVDVTGLPPYARSIDILLRGWSPNDNNGFLLLLGTVDGVVTSGYSQGTCSVTGASQAGLGPLQGFPLFSNVASGIATATIQLRSVDGLYWSISGVAGYEGANNCVAFSSIALTKPLTTLRFTKYTGGSCDAGTATVIWRA